MYPPRTHVCSVNLLQVRGVSWNTLTYWSMEELGSGAHRNLALYSLAPGFSIWQFRFKSDFPRSLSRMLELGGLTVSLAFFLLSKFQAQMAHCLISLPSPPRHLKGALCSAWHRRTPRCPHSRKEHVHPQPHVEKSTPIPPFLSFSTFSFLVVLSIPPPNMVWSPLLFSIFLLPHEWRPLALLLGCDSSSLCRPHCDPVSRALPLMGTWSAVPSQTDPEGTGWERFCGLSPWRHSGWW